MMLRKILMTSKFSKIKLYDLNKIKSIIKLYILVYKSTHLQSTIKQSLTSFFILNNTEYSITNNLKNCYQIKKIKVPKG